MFEDRGLVEQAAATGFGGRRVLVVGDLMLDRNVYGSVARISPEAPVPVVKVTGESEAAGGAGNVARNLAALGLDTAVGGLVGNDAPGERLIELLRTAGIDTNCVVEDGDRPTTTKTRVMSGHHQMLRLDLEDSLPISGSPYRRLVELVSGELRPTVRALVLSDYAKGALSAEACIEIIARAVQMRIPVLADPKGDDFRKYRGATVLSPNRGELATVVRRDPGDLDGLLEAGSSLREEIGVTWLVVTLGDQGMALIGDQSTSLIPTAAKGVFDVTGAGDTVIATAAAGLAVGLSTADSLALASLAAGIVVGKVGTEPIALSELAGAIASVDSSDGDKLYTLAEITGMVATWRGNGERIVFTNGCFDVLHAGHISLLEQARSLGDRLIVGLNSDDSVRRLKGEPRPYVTEADRARLLAALRSVDGVVTFTEDTPLELIRALRPDVLVKGSDYSEDEVVGASDVRSWGGEVALARTLEGYSTSGLIGAIKETAQSESPSLG